MNKDLLKLLESSARMSCEDMACALGTCADEVERELGELERSGVIRGYKAIIDGDAIDGEAVSAIIELKVTPKAGLGFEDVAERIASYPYVESVSLMSGVCDLLVTVRGKSFKEVCTFVAEELAVIDGVTSTATQFIMKKYKEYGVPLFGDADDGRGRISL